MNYYPHHIGDYARDTAHLSMLEDAAYRRMLDLYYASERPLPLNRDGLYRLVRARSKPEKDAVDIVLGEFFQESPNGWRNPRADLEIAKAKEEGLESQARKENEAERQRRHRERRRQLFEELRKYGEVPKWDTSAEALEALLVTLKSRDCHAPVTRDRPSPVTDLQRLTNSQEPRAKSHKPGTKNQEPREKTKPQGRAFALPEWVPQEPWDAWLKIRKPRSNTAEALELVVKKLEQFRAGGMDPKAVLEQSIVSGWQGLFPLKGVVGGGKQADLEARNKAAADAWLASGEEGK